jgi:drug/metabolite transporter (DMT)-like permease
VPGGLPGEHDYSGANVSSPLAYSRQDTRLAVLALLAGTLVWGTIWYPYRALSEAGFGALSASLLTYLVALALALVMFGREGLVRPDLELMVLALAAGFTNVGFVWATNHGIILRVLLLFYLMPLWTVLFSWLLLGKLPHKRGALLLGLALCGAALMLYRPGAGLPLPASAAEWAGLLAGMCFALSNVLVHRAAQHNARCKSIWILSGCVLVGALGMLFFETPRVADFSWQVLALVLALGAVLFCVNVCVQQGLERLPPARVPLIYLFELVVAAFASWLLAKEAIELRELLGGALILAATLVPHEVPPAQAVGRAPATAP